MTHEPERRAEVETHLREEPVPLNTREAHVSLFHDDGRGGTPSRRASWTSRGLPSSRPTRW
jgi:hypothetical protein